MTPHNDANKKDIAKTVLMPGDPLRAKYIAENYLTDVKCFNKVRNMYGYTGKYKGKEVSIMASGMGIPSIGIYSYELYTQYDVDNIIRIGSAGAISDDLNLLDIVIGMGACTNSNYASQYNLNGTFAPIADYEILSKAVECAKENDINVMVGNLLSSDIFYNDDKEDIDKWKKLNVLAVEMETAALYMNAARLNKKALGIMTISDHFYKEGILTTKQRELSLNQMIKIALDVVFTL